MIRSRMSNQRVVNTSKEDPSAPSGSSAQLPTRQSERLKKPQLNKSHKASGDLHLANRIPTQTFLAIVLQDAFSFLGSWRIKKSKKQQHHHQQRSYPQDIRRGSGNTNPSINSLASTQASHLPSFRHIGRSFSYSFASRSFLPSSVSSNIKSLRRIFSVSDINVSFVSQPRNAYQEGSTEQNGVSTGGIDAVSTDRSINGIAASDVQGDDHDPENGAEDYKVVREAISKPIPQKLFFFWQLFTVFIGASQLLWAPIGAGAVVLTEDPISRALREYSFPPRFLHKAYLGCVSGLVVFVTLGAVLSFIPTKTLLSTFGSTLCVYGRGIWYFTMIALSVPIISTLLSIFLCEHTSSSTLVHQIDPAIVCWGGSHVGLIIASMASLVLFYYAFVVKRMEVYTRLERTKVSSTTFFYEHNPVHFFGLLATKSIFCITSTFVALKYKHPFLWVNLMALVVCIVGINIRISFTNIRAHGLQSALLISATVSHILALSEIKINPLGLGISTVVCFLISYVVCVARASWPKYNSLLSCDLDNEKEVGINKASKFKDWLKRVIFSLLCKKNDNTQFFSSDQHDHLKLSYSLGGAKIMFSKKWCPVLSNPVQFTGTTWLLRVKNLDLRGNELDTRDVKILCLSLLTQKIPVETLDLGHNYIGNHAAGWISILIKYHSSLRTLGLNENPLLGTRGLEILVDGIISSPISRLRRLLLDFCDLDSQAAYPVSKIIKCADNLPLTELSLRGNNLCAEGASILSHAIRSIQPTPLRLRLEWNGLKKEGLSHLIHAIHDNPYQSMSPSSEFPRRDGRTFYLIDIRMSMNGFTRKEMVQIMDEVKMRHMCGILSGMASQPSTESIHSSIQEEDEILEEKARESLPDPYPGTLLEAIGGESVLSLVVDDFYYRLVTDPQLKPFFRDISMNRMLHLQLSFLSAGMGGASTSKAANLRRAHQHLGLTDDHFDATISHLVAAIYQHNQDFPTPALLNLHAYTESLRSCIVYTTESQNLRHKHRDAASFIKQYESHSLSKPASSIGSRPGELSNNHRGLTSTMEQDSHVMDLTINTGIKIERVESVEDIVQPFVPDETRPSIENPNCVEQSIVIDII